MSDTSIRAKLLDQIRASIARASRFLEGSQWPGGYWIDFELYVGRSNQWVTAYVAHSLARAVPQSPALAPALAYLLRTELSAGGWGYNRHVPPDGDSTANAVYFLARYAAQHVEPAILQRSAATLAAFQSASDGGFVTYLARPPRAGEERPAFMYEGSGWTISHLSVTGLAGVALLASDAALESENYLARREHAAAFIRDMQAAGGYWEDHWWQDRIYGTYWAARCLAIRHLPIVASTPRNETSADTQRVLRAQDWIAGQAGPGGAWGNGKGGPGAAFYTALALSTLLLPAGRPIDGFAAPLQGGLAWLLEAQLPDGSWPSVPMLLTPVPEVLVPWDSDHPSSHEPTADQDRIFTSATVLAALARARDWLE